MRHRIAPALLVLGPLLAVAAPPPNPTSLDAGAAARFAALALKCLHQEYPNHLSHTLGSDADARPPRELTPAFYGCYDWHSAVHGHWLLVRLLRLFPGAPFASQARAAVSRSLTVPNISAEVAYLRGDGRASFERPYGLAWLLQLAAELRGWDDPDAQRWSAALRPLESQEARETPRHHATFGAARRPEAGRARVFAHSRCREMSSPIVVDSGIVSFTARTRCFFEIRRFLDFWSWASDWFHGSLKPR